MKEMDERSFHRDAPAGRRAGKVRDPDDDASVKSSWTRIPAKAFVGELLETITKECMHDGADLVGHIKAFVYSEHKTTLGASLIHQDMPVNITNALDERGLTVGDMTVHVIVHGIWDDTVMHASMESIESVMPKYGIKYDMLQDYYETEKGIAHHK